jgi:hypothetical protein
VLTLLTTFKPVVLISWSLPYSRSQWHEPITFNTAIITATHIFEMEEQLCHLDSSFHEW